jgi:cytochrome c-type biogenesis protein CcmH/NrfF
MRWTALLLALAMATASSLGWAADAQPTERDSVAAARAVKLSEKLRCLVCQNQSIADSSAELAQDLRQQIREQIAAGKTDDEIIAYMVARYGDFVLYEPPFKATTVCCGRDRHCWCSAASSASRASCRDVGPRPAGALAGRANARREAARRR